MGHLPRLRDGSVLHTGTVSRDVTREQGAAARQALVHGLAHLTAALGTLDDGARRVEGAAALAGGRGQRRPPSPGWSGVECGGNRGKAHVNEDGERSCARIL